MDQMTGQKLASLELGQRARVIKIAGAGAVQSGRLDVEELERRLLEIGFIEGDELQILHFGPIDRDPIAIQLGHMIVALRRQEADAIIVEPL